MTDTIRIPPPPPTGEHPPVAVVETDAVFPWAGVMLKRLIAMSPCPSCQKPPGTHAGNCNFVTPLMAIAVWEISHPIDVSSEPAAFANPVAHEDPESMPHACVECGEAVDHQHDKQCTFCHRWYHRRNPCGKHIDFHDPLPPGTKCCTCGQDIDVLSETPDVCKHCGRARHSFGNCMVTACQQVPVAGATADNCRDAP